MVLNILKEADINFFFKVLAKFGGNNIKIMEKKCFFSIEGGWGGVKISMENSMTFNVFFIETFPK